MWDIRPPKLNSNNHEISNRSKIQHHASATVHKEKKRFLSAGWIILIIVLLIIITPVIYYFYAVNIPVGNSNKNIALEVVEGESTTEIADNLAEKHLIRDSYSFSLYVYLNKITLLPGIYYLTDSMNYNAIVDPIKKGISEENKVTIIEGLSREEIAQLLEKNDIVTSKDFMQASEGKEGYLFPDTYRFKKDIRAKEIVDILFNNFKTKTASLNPTTDDVILASIIEREAKYDEDRAKIAGVYKNRLDSGMKLDADPTVQYAKGNWEALKVSDYSSTKSPYNTYLNKGLPPSPICNPGLASIKAAVNPEEHDYLYFLTKNDGTVLYAKTLEEHNANKKK